MRLASRYKSINPISHNENTFAYRNEFHLAVEDEAQILTWVWFSSESPDLMSLNR